MGPDRQQGNIRTVLTDRIVPRDQPLASHCPTGSSHRLSPLQGADVNLL